MAALPSQPQLDPHLHQQQRFVQAHGKEEEEHEATLLVRHLPEAIPQDTLTRLFSHYGASSVRPCAGGRYPQSSTSLELFIFNGSFLIML